MAISVAVPKNLSGIKTKVAMNLTKRQLVCFGSAGAVGIPFYIFTKGVIGTQASALIMVALMLPFFFLAMYEKDGFPAEKILYFMLRQKILTPGIRPYKSENLYRQLEEKERMKRRCAILKKKPQAETQGRQVRAAKPKAGLSFSERKRLMELKRTLSGNSKNRKSQPRHRIPLPLKDVSGRYLSGDFHFLHENGGVF